MLDFAIAITNVIGVGIKSFDDPGSKQARGQKKSQSKRKRAKHHKRAKNSKRSKNQDKKKKNRGSSKGSDGKVDERKRKTTYYDDDDDDEQPADKVTGENRKRPLGEKLPDGIKVEDDRGNFWTLTGAIELHRLVLKDDYYQLKKQKNEITSKIIDSTCAVEDLNDYYKEVSQLPLPLLPRSRHCSLHVGLMLIKQLCCS